MARTYFADCKDKVSDVAVIVDVSFSTTPGEFDTQLNAVEQALKTTQVGSSKTQFSYTIFATTSNNVFDFGQYSTSSEMIIEVNKNSHRDDSVLYPNASHVLYTLKNSGFSSSTGSRTSARKIVLLISQGHFGDIDLAKQHIDDLKGNGVTVVTVGIGLSSNVTLLRDLASDPALSYNVGEEIYTNVNVLRSLYSTITFRHCS